MKPRTEYSVIKLTDIGELEERTLEHVQSIRRLVLQLLSERQMTKTELAARMGISKSHLSNILNYQTNLTLETITRFELALGIEFEIKIK